LTSEKEAKRLSSRFLGVAIFLGMAVPQALPPGKKFFGSFFSKKNIFVC
jgi:hypothetical protein